MKKFSFGPTTSMVAVGVGGVGLFVLLVLCTKAAWNSFFAAVLHFPVMDWSNTLALVFWIALGVAIIVGVKESGK